MNSSDQQHDRTPQVEVPTIGRPENPTNEVSIQHLLEVENELREWADNRRFVNATQEAERIEDMADWVLEAASTDIVDCENCGSGATIHTGERGVLECLQCESEFEP